MEFTLKTTIKASAKTIFSAWLDSEQHKEMTGGEAKISDKPGEKFTAWDGYISGKNLIIEPYQRIVQTWRTSEFGEEDDDSEIEILFQETKGTTEITLTHKNLSDAGKQYIKGWEEHYFLPMKKYFSK